MVAWVLLQTPPVAAIPHSSPLQALSTQPTAVLFLWTAHSTLSFRPCPYLRTRVWGRGVQGSSTPVCAGVSSACRRWALSSPLSLWTPLSVPADLRGLPRMREPLLSSAPSQGRTSRPSILFSSSYLREAFLVLSGVWGLLLVSSRCSVRCVLFVDVSFLLFVGGGELPILRHISIGAYPILFPYP